jgi:hypothetical protein
VTVSLVPVTSRASMSGNQETTPAVPLGRRTNRGLTGERVPLMSNASTRQAGYDGFHLAVCAANRDDEPASDNWCVRECPRRLLSEVDRLRADNDRLRQAILDWWDDLNLADATRADEQLRATVDEVA